MTEPAGAPERRICVLKFGGSVLAGEGDYRAVAQEIYGHVREGEKIIAVVSAIAGETDALLEQALRVGGNPADAFVARLARVGELRSSALLGLALNRMGIRAATLDPHEIELLAEGEPLDANLVALNRGKLENHLAENDVLVLPGFIAGHREHGLVTLGRGGTDLSAVFFAAQTGAQRVRLLKDVDGVYHEDPVKDPKAERYGSLSYDEAAAASRGLIQEKAIDEAKTRGIVIEVGAVGHREATLIGNLPARREVPLTFPRLKVALLGCGDVGAGVLSYLKERPDLFDLRPVLVRSPARHVGLFDHDFTASTEDALEGELDLVIELIGGADYAADLMCSALRRGVHVVTANKAAVAAHLDELQASASAGGADFYYSAAVGGGAPVLETIDRLRRQGGIRVVEGVVNGTCNFLLSKLEEGWPLDQAIARAQALGFAEADPSVDIDGGDAADKLCLLAHAAFGVRLLPGDVPRQSVRGLLPADAERALASGRRLKQVARCELLGSGVVTAEVVVTALPATHPMAGASNEENRFRITTSGESVHEVFGKGAGRWPTSAAVFADILDLQRKLAGENQNVQGTSRSAPLAVAAA